MVASTEDTVYPSVTDTEGFVQDVQHIAAYFYVENGLLAFTQMERLYWSFTNLMELFDRVFLRLNVANKAIMACHPCRNLGGHYAEVCSLRMTGDGNTYW